MGASAKWFMALGILFLLSAGAVYLRTAPSTKETMLNLRQPVESSEGGDRPEQTAHLVSEASERHAQNERIRQLEDQVTALQAEVRAARNQKSAADTTDSRAHPLATKTSEEIAEAKRRHIEAHEQALRAHAAEAVDRSWAPMAMAMFRDDFARASAQIGAQVLGVDCRTKLCVARFRWPTYTEARRHFPDAMRTPLRMNCAQEITLPDPLDATQPYDASMILDCGDNRGDP